MFNTLSNLVTGVTKVAVGAVVTPVAVVADVVTLIPDSVDGDDPFTRTSKSLNLVSEGINDAIKGESK